MSLRSTFQFSLKLILVSGLFYFLIKKGLISVEATEEALEEWQIIVPTVLALFVATLLQVFRWQWLLQVQKIRLSWFETFKLTLIGNFFNIALPGAVSGDFVKAFYIGKMFEGHRSAAFGSILFDRLTGLSALVLVSAGALLLGLKSYLDSPVLKAVQVLMITAAISVVFFYGYLLLVRENHDPLLKLLRSIQEKFPNLKSLARIYESIRNYHHHRLTLLKVLSVSVLIHLIVGAGCLQFAYALKQDHLTLGSIYLVVPLGLLITAIPVAPAGVGTGNLAFFYFFQLIGSERGADVFSLYALSNIFIGLFGGLIYLKSRQEVSLPLQTASN